MAVTISLPRIKFRADRPSPDELSERLSRLEGERPIFGALPIRRFNRRQYPQQPDFPAIFEDECFSVDNGGHSRAFFRGVFAGSSETGCQLHSKRDAKTENQTTNTHPGFLRIQSLREQGLAARLGEPRLAGKDPPCAVLGPESVTTDRKLLISLARVPDDPTTIHRRREMREH